MTSASHAPSTPGSQKSSRPWRALVIVGGALVAWLGLSEIATAFWYSSHEATLTPNKLPATGDVLMERLKQRVKVREIPSKEQEIGDAAMEMLKCSYGKTLVWADGPEFAAMTVLKWDGKSAVGGVETQHNPGICLSAAGWKIGQQTDLGVQKFGDTFCDVTEWEVSRNDLDMRAYSAIFRRFGQSKAARADLFRNSERLESVLLGRRDAPVLVLLAYLPARFGEEGARAEFREIMEGLFGKSVAP